MYETALFVTCLPCQLTLGSWLLSSKAPAAISRFVSNWRQLQWQGKHYSRPKYLVKGVPANRAFNPRPWFLDKFQNCWAQLIGWLECQICGSFSSHNHLVPAPNKHIITYPTPPPTTSSSFSSKIKVVLYRCFTSVYRQIYGSWRITHPTKKSWLPLIFTPYYNPIGSPNMPEETHLLCIHPLFPRSFPPSPTIPHPKPAPWNRRHPTSSAIAWHAPSCVTSRWNKPRPPPNETKEALALQGVGNLRLWSWVPGTYLEPTWPLNLTIWRAPHKLNAHPYYLKFLSNESSGTLVVHNCAIGSPPQTADVHVALGDLRL